MPVVHSFIISAILLAPVSPFPDSVTHPLAMTEAIAQVYECRRSRRELE